MKPLSSIFTFLEATQKELSHLLAAPTAFSIDVKDNAVVTKSQLQDLDTHYVFLYDRNNFEKGVERFKQEAGTHTPCQIRELPHEYARKIESGLFGVLENFSFGAYSSRRLGASYITKAEIQYEDSKFYISCNGEEKINLCQLHKITALQQLPLGLADMLLSNHSASTAKPFADIAKNLDDKESAFIDVGQSTLLFTREIGAETKTTLSEYLDKSSQVSGQIISIIDTLCAGLSAQN